ncbi:MAG: peptidoglycan-binding protein [Elainella sp. Prado103]|jgi:hypothetical protein|nr:peptidoglycan-binding protein [Elainella sp. Prado103]
METVAYLELSQNYEADESKVLSPIRLSPKTAATAASVTGAALMLGALAETPALAYHYGCCRPVLYRPVVYRPVVYRPVFYPVGCYQPCYYPQSHYPSYDDTSYYPEEDCDCSGDEGYEDSYQEIAFHPVGFDSNILRLGSAGEYVALLQQALIDAGFNPGPVDGLFGHQTAEAVAQYQAANGLLVDGIAGGQTLDSLGIAGAGA